MIRILLRVLGPRYAAPVLRAISLMVAAAVAEGLSYAMVFPVLRALLGADPAGAWPWMIAFAGAVAVYGALRYWGDLSAFGAATAQLRGMYHRLGDHLAHLPIGWYDGARIGEVSVLASKGVLQTMGVIVHLLGPFIFACITPLTIVLVMLVFNWQMGLAALLAAPVVVAAQVWTGRAMARSDARRAERDQESSARVIEYLQAQPVLRTSGRTSERFALLDDAMSGLERASRGLTFSVLPGVVGLSLAVQAMFSGLLALGAYLALGGRIGPVEVLTMLVLAARSADPLLSLSDSGGKLRSARFELERLDAILRTQPLSEPLEPVKPSRHDLEFDAVTFRHGERTVIDNLSLSVPQGERLAIVGPSGAGKSTLLRLIARFHDVEAGAVRLGGVDVRDIATTNLIDQISFVFQDVYLFDGTIEENVRIGRPDAQESELRAAAAAARLDEVVARLPDGWSTHVGEGGTLLSGGERQRVSIARALLKDAPIVLLDELTSALDPVNEAAVHESIERLIAGRTVVMVGHRLRTVECMDRIVFLNDGRIVAEGRHDELLRSCESYAAFWSASMASIAGGRRTDPVKGT